MRDEQPALPSPPGPGAPLRELRMARGMAREDMARATRIGQGYLDALEADRLADLPAPVFVKGFIRAYCEHLGEQPDVHLRRYRQFLGERDEAEALPAARPRRESPLSPVWISLALVAILGVGLFALTQVGRSPRERVAQKGPERSIPAAPERVPAPPAAQPAAEQVSATPRADSPAVAGGRAPGMAPGPAAPEGALRPPVAGSVGPVPGRVAPAPPPPQESAPRPPRPAGSAPLKLTVRAVEQTWLRVQTEDGQVAAELLEAGTVREWTSESRFVLTVGNAAGIELTLNGQPMPSLGGRGVVRRLEIPGPSAAEASPSR